MPEANAFGGQVIGSIATPCRRLEAGSSVSPVYAWMWPKASSAQTSIAADAVVRSRPLYGTGRRTRG